MARSRLYTRRVRESLFDEARRASQTRSLGLDVLDEVCQTRVTESAVKLTDDLVKRRRLLRWGDPLGLVETTLMELNEAGLLIYAERDENGVPIRIRATTEGFLAAGYRLRHSEVGRRRSGLHHGERTQDGGIKRPGDRTDFRVHDATATAIGEIERMPLREHVMVYPDHAQSHWAQLKEMDEMARPRKYPQATAVAIYERHEAGETFPSIAQDLGLPAPTAWELARRVERERASDYEAKPVPHVIQPTEDASVRQRVARALVEHGQLNDAEHVLRVVRRPGEVMSMSDIVGALWSLQKQGDVAFHQAMAGGNGHGPKQGSLTRIKPQPQLLHRLATTRFPDAEAGPAGSADAEWTEPQEASDDTGADAPAPEALTPQPDDEGDESNATWLAAFPVLSDLRARAQARDDEAAKANRYMEAAALIESTDRETADMLVAKAESLMDGLNLSRVESEYLAFAERFAPSDPVDPTL